MASVGSLKPLLEMLQAAPTLQGASVVYGEENINSENYPLPMVVIVPTGGSYVQPGYMKGASTTLDQLWGINSTVDIYCWAVSTDPANQEPIDHADATENLRAQVIQAFQNQRDAGLYYKPIAERWETMQDAQSRYGRALVLTVLVEITIPDVQPPTATVTTLEVDSSITPPA